MLGNATLFCVPTAEPPPAALAAEADKPKAAVSIGAPPALSPAARHPRADPAGSRRVGIGE